MNELRLVRLQSEFIEMEINMDEFEKVSEFQCEMFGWNKNLYFSIKHDI